MLACIKVECNWNRDSIYWVKNIADILFYISLLWYRVTLKECDFEDELISVNVTSMSRFNHGSNTKIKHLYTDKRC